MLQNIYKTIVAFKSPTTHELQLTSHPKSHHEKRQDKDI